MRPGWCGVRSTLVGRFDSFAGRGEDREIRPTSRFRRWLGPTLRLVVPVVALAAAGAAAGAADSSANVATDQERARLDVVVIDPGHGGPDPGARGRGKLTEKRLVFEISRRLGAELEAQGLRVVYTRDGDDFVSLAQRSAIANRAQGDLFLSIHANSAPRAEAHGVETYFLSTEASDEEALRVAQIENQVFDLQTSAPGSASVLGPILADLIRTEHLRASSRLASGIQRALEGVSKVGRGVKQAPFVVLTGVNMPAALIEVGFLTHREEARRLGTERYQQQLAVALAAAVLRYRNTEDLRVQSSIRLGASR